MKTRNLPFIAVLIGLVLIVPAVVFAQNQPFVPLTGVPGVDPSTQTLEPYIKALYFLSIGLASALAVVKIIAAGVKYMLSDVVTDKGKAKSDIRSALIGLLLILGAVTILNEINPNLTNLAILRNASSVTITNRDIETPTPTPDPCDIDPTLRGCLLGVLTYEQYEELRERCGSKIIRKPDGTLSCERPPQEPTTDRPWELLDTNARIALDRICADGHCDILYYGESRDVDEQEDYCLSHGGDELQGPFDGHYICTREN